MAAWHPTNGKAAIVAGSRTAWAKVGTALRDVHVCDMAARSMQETLYRANWPENRVDEVILGNVVMPADATNPGRVAALWAGVPQTTPAVTVQRNCASGMESIGEAAARIESGRANCVLAGGAESMSQIPLLLPPATLDLVWQYRRTRTPWQKLRTAASLRPRHLKPVVGLELGLTDPTCGMIMGRTAEVLAHEFGITRREQDEFALRSHQRAAAAMEAGRFAEEIVPLYAGRKHEPVTQDVGPRSNQSLDALARLTPVFDRRDGTVTVGNACQVTDGAATVLLMNDDLARSEGRNVLGHVRGYAYVGLDPARMGLGPALAIAALAQDTGVPLSEVGLFEINEAFAAQVLACLKAMASGRFAREQLGRNEPLIELDPDKLNVNGGAIALGHPVGATGTRLVLTLLMEMQRRNVELGIAALCVGGGQGAAILLQRS